MNFYDFLQLQETEQVEVLWYNGEQIGRRREGEYLILLYQVEGFYVEVFYHSKLREIKRYLSFDCTERLEPYIESIDISPVYRYMKKQPKSTLYAAVVNTPVLSLSAEAKENKKRKQSIWEIFLSIFQKKADS
ncbi:MAG: hypothetical protein ACJ75B_19955 [Flavisolibacter sp.]